MSAIASEPGVEPAAEHETKLVFDARLADVAARWLGRRCAPDARHPAGRVASIYYDTPDWRLLRDSLDGDFLKLKVRARWYCHARSGEPAGDVFLEAKYKLGARRAKVRLRAERPAEWIARAHWNDPALVALPRALRSEGVLVPDALVPWVEIAYLRRRFVDPSSGARIALDHDIRAARVNPRVLPRRASFRLSRAVLEVKGAPRGLPPALLPLALLGLRKSSFSKYGECYREVVGAIP